MSERESEISTTDNTRLFDTHCPDGLPDFIPNGGYVVDLSQSVKSDIEKYLEISHLGIEFNNLIGRITSGMKKDDIIKEIECFKIYSDRIPYENLGEMSLLLLNEGLFSSSIIFLAKYIDRNPKGFAHLMSQIILLYSDICDKNKEQISPEEFQLFEHQLKGLIDSRALFLNTKGATILEGGEYRRILGLFFERIVKDDTKAELEYIRGIQTCDDPGCYFLEGAIKSRYDSLEGARELWYLGWTRHREKDSLIGLLGIALEEKSVGEFIKYFQIGKQLGILGNTNYDMLAHSCNPETPIEILFIVCENTELFSQAGKVNLTKILNNKLHSLSEGSHWHENLNIYLLQVIHLGDKNAILSVLAHLHDLIDQDNVGMKGILNYFSSSPSSVLGLQSLDMPLWSGSSDEPILPERTSEGLYQKIELAEVGKSGVLEFLRFLRCLSLSILDGDIFEDGLTLVSDLISYLQEHGYSHLEEIEFMKREIQFQMKFLINASNTKDAWNDDTKDAFLSFRELIDFRQTTRARSDMLIQFYQGELDIKGIKDKNTFLYLFGELVSWFVDDEEILETILEQLYSFIFDADESAYIASILARLPSHGEIAMEYIVQADLTNPEVLYDFSLAFTNFQLITENERGIEYESDRADDTPDNQSHKNDMDTSELDNEFNEAVNHFTASKSILDHIRKIYYRTLRKNKNDTRTLGLLEYSLAVQYESAGFLKTSYIYYKKSSDRGNIHSKEKLALLLFRQEKYAESKDVSISLAEIAESSGYVNLFYQANEDGNREEAKRILHILTEEKSELLDECRIEYLMNGTYEEKIQALQYVVSHTFLLPKLPNGLIDQCFDTANFLYEQYKEKPKSNWDVEDHILWLDVLRFRYQVLDGNTENESKSEISELGRGRLLEYWSAIHLLIQNSKDITTRDGLRQASGKKILLQHLDKFFSSYSFFETFLEKGDTLLYTDNRFGESDFYLISEAFDKDSVHIHNALEFSLSCLVTDIFQILKEQDDNTQSLRDFIAMVLWEIIPDSQVIRYLGYGKLQGKDLLKAYSIRMATLDAIPQ